MAATAVEAWDEGWATPEGRADWLVPHPAVSALVPVLNARGAQRSVCSILAAALAGTHCSSSSTALPLRRSMVPLPASGTTALGGGCVKTRAFNLRVESPS
jgi:hypothetical protein